MVALPGGTPALQVENARMSKLNGPSGSARAGSSIPAAPGHCRAVEGAEAARHVSTDIRAFIAANEAQLKVKD